MKGELKVCEACGALFARVLGKSHTLCTKCDLAWLKKKAEEK